MKKHSPLVLASAVCCVMTALPAIASPAPASTENYIAMAKETLSHAQGDRRHSWTSLTGMHYTISREDAKTTYAMRLVDSALAIEDLALYARFDPKVIRPVVMEKTSAGVSMATTEAGPTIEGINRLVDQAEKIVETRQPLAAGTSMWQDVIQDAAYGDVQAEFHLSSLDRLESGEKVLLIEYRATLPQKLMLSGHLVIDAEYRKPLQVVTRQHRIDGEETFTLVREMALQTPQGKPLFTQTVTPRFPVDSVFAVEQSVNAPPLPTTAKMLRHALGADLKVLAAAERQVNPIPLLLAVAVINIDGAVEATMNIAGAVGSLAFKDSPDSFAKSMFAGMADYKGGVQLLGEAIGGETGGMIAQTASAVLGVGGLMKGGAKLLTHGIEMLAGGSGALTRAAQASGRIGSFVPDVGGMTSRALEAAYLSGRSPTLNTLFAGAAREAGHIGRITDPAPISGLMANLASRFGRQGEYLAGMIRRTNLGDNAFAFYETTANWAEWATNRQVAQAVSQSGAAGLAAAGLSPAGSASSGFLGAYLHETADVAALSQAAQAWRAEVAALQRYEAAMQQLQMQYLFDLQARMTQAASVEKARAALDVMAHSELIWEDTKISGYYGYWPAVDQDVPLGDPTYGRSAVVPAGASTYITGGGSASSVITTYMARPGTFNAPVTAVYAFAAPYVSYTQGLTKGAYAEMSINGGTAQLMTASEAVRAPWGEFPDVITDDYSYFTDWVTAKEIVSLRDGGKVEVTVHAPENGAVWVIEKH